MERIVDVLFNMGFEDLADLREVRAAQDGSASGPQAVSCAEGARKPSPEEKIRIRSPRYAHGPRSKSSPPADRDVLSRYASSTPDAGHRRTVGSSPDAGRSGGSPEAVTTPFRTPQSANVRNKSSPPAGRGLRACRSTPYAYGGTPRSAARSDDFTPQRPWGAAPPLLSPNKTVDLPGPRSHSSDSAVRGDQPSYLGRGAAGPHPTAAGA